MLYIAWHWLIILFVIVNWEEVYNTQVSFMTYKAFAVDSNVANVLPVVIQYSEA